MQRISKLLIYLQYIANVVHRFRKFRWRSTDTKGRGDKSCCQTTPKRRLAHQRQIPEPSGQSSSPQSQKRVSGWTNQLYGCGKISRPPGARNPDPVPRQFVVTEGHCAPSISNRGQKEHRRQSISECEASPHTFDAVHEMAAAGANTADQC
jgi:hypothetical protein